MMGLCDATRGQMRVPVQVIQSAWTGALEGPRAASHVVHGPEHPGQPWGRR